MATLPNNESFTGSGVTQGGFRTALNSLLDYLRESVGSAGGAANWRTALGLGALATRNDVTAAQIATGAVNAEKIADGAVETAKLAANSVTLAKIEATTRSALAVPPGTVLAVARSTAPDGYLKCNGAAVSRTTYAALFAAIGTTWGAGDGSTTFNLPDLRGEFLRGWDDGRGVDAGRAFASSQAGEIQSHTHTASTGSAGAHSHTTPTGLAVGAGSTGLPSTGSNNTANVSSTDGAHTHSVTINNAGGSETRPRNVALLYVIKF
jgi:microcystin-dependent protein